VAVPVGIILVPFVHSFDPSLVSRAVLATGCVTGIMMMASMAWPGVFLKMGRALFFSLITVIVVEMGMWFMGVGGSSIIDWIVVLIFSGYIGYDWARANAIPKTLDNAVDCAAALYLDIINLFVRLLRLFGRR